MVTIPVTIGQMTWSGHARETLRAGGYRGGAARDAVIDLLDARSCCIGAQELYEQLHAEGRKVGLASVYRVLDTLAEHGLVQRVEIGDGVARFEPHRHGGDHHHHLVCDSCGKVEAFADDTLETAIRNVERRSRYSVAAHEVVLHGACEDCTPQR
jgi:Fur family ferric uptake transcriptional regulator